MSVVPASMGVVGVMKVELAQVVGVGGQLLGVRMAVGGVRALLIYEGCASWVSDLVPSDTGVVRAVYVNSLVGDKGLVVPKIAISQPVQRLSASCIKANGCARLVNAVPRAVAQVRIE